MLTVSARFRQRLFRTTNQNHRVSHELTLVVYIQVKHALHTSRVGMQALIANSPGIIQASSDTMNDVRETHNKSAIRDRAWLEATLQIVDPSYHC
jgi:hypothetical protein